MSLTCKVCQKDDRHSLTDGACSQCIADVVFPVIHRNGTSAGALFKECDLALDATRNALELVEMMAPNQRDYYFVATSEPRRFNIAVFQHSRRVELLNNVIRQLEVILEEVGSHL